VYEVWLERGAERDIKTLPDEIFQNIVANLRKLGENPRPFGCRKLSGSKNDWRIRVGNYRIIYEIIENAKAVRIMRVRQRKDAYR